MRSDPESLKSIVFVMSLFIVILITAIVAASHFEKSQGNKVVCGGDCLLSLYLFSLCMCNSLFLCVHVFYLRVCVLMCTSLCGVSSLYLKIGKNDTKCFYPLKFAINV